MKIKRIRKDKTRRRESREKKKVEGGREGWRMQRGSEETEQSNKEKERERRGGGLEARFSWAFKKTFVDLRDQPFLIFHTQKQPKYIFQ